MGGDYDGENWIGFVPQDVAVIPSLWYSEMNNQSFGLAFDIVEGVISYSCMGLVIITIPIYLVVVAVLFFERNSHTINNVFFSIYLVSSKSDFKRTMNFILDWWIARHIGYVQ